MKLETMLKHAENFYASGEYKKALKIFKKINALRPDNDSLNYIGCCHIELGEYERAREIFLQLIAASPDWERPHFNSFALICNWKKTNWPMTGITGYSLYSPIIRLH